MAKIKNILKIGVAIGSVTFPMAANAQGAETSAADGNEIIVTARRVEERLQDVPISITVFNQGQLDDRNVTSGADLAAYTPSLTVNTRNGAATASFAIRGFSQETRTTASVATYFADVVAPRGGHDSRPVGDGAGPGAFFDLQNVQVLKGPQGTLFGRNTTGGAVLLVPQKPVASLEGYVEASYGNYDMKRLQGVLNVPLSDTFRVRLGGDWQKRDGYLRNVSGIGPSHFGDVEYHSFRLSIVGDLTPNLENYTIATYARSDTNGEIPVLQSCNPALFPLGPLACDALAKTQAGGFYAVHSPVASAHAYLRQWQVINTTTWKATDTLTVKNIASYGEIRYRSHSDSFGTGWVLPQTLSNNTGTINIPTGAFAGSPLGFATIMTPPGGTQGNQAAFTEELRLEGISLNDRLLWQAGFYMELSDPLGFNRNTTPSILSCSDVFAFQCVDPLATLLNAGPVGNLTSQRFKTAYHDYGVYGQASFNITEALKLTGGLRYTWNKTKSQATDVRYTYFPAMRVACGDASIPFVTEQSCFEKLSVNSSAPTWLLGLDYKPAEDVLLYAKYARGYRQGSTSSLAAPGFRTYGPEKVDTYEVGSKVSWRGGIPGFFNIAGFYNDFRDQQLTVGVIQLPASVNSATLNVGRSRIWGAEVEAGITPFEGLRLDGSYAYLNTKVTRLDPIAPTPGFFFVNPTVVGQDLPLTPKHKFSITGTYTLPLDESIGDVSFGATFSHVGDQSVNASPLTHIPSYDLLNLNFNWKTIAGSPIDLSVFATNVTNEKYVVYINDNLSRMGFISATTGMPRMYGVRLRYNFGR